MRGKKYIVVLGLCLATVLFIAGCGQGEKQEVQQSSVNSVSVNHFMTEKDIVQQANESAHAHFFREMVALGPEGVKAAHYSDNCIGCHSAVKMFDDPSAVLNDFFPGGKYAGQLEGISCRVCHVLDTEEGIALRKEGWAVCGDCHTAQGRPKLGSAVHHPQNEMIRGFGVGEVPDIPSYKCFNMIDFSCYDCHLTNAVKHDYMVPGVTVTDDGVTQMDYKKFEEVLKQERCIGCHQIVEDTVQSVKTKQEYISKKLEELMPLYEEWGEKTGAMDPNDPRVKTFGEATTYLTYVDADASKGAHNYELAKALLEKAEEKFNELQ